MTVKKLRMKGLMLISAAVILFPISMVQATTQNIDATANFLAAITLSGSSIDFSNIIYSGVPGSSDWVNLGTNGTVTYGGNFSAATGASVAAGDVTITAGTNGAVIEVSCDDDATLTNGSGSAINVEFIRIAAENVTAGPGSGPLCSGIGTAVTVLTLNMGTLDSFKLGGFLWGFTASGFAGGAHSTGNAGGDDIQVDVTYQ